MYDEIRFDTVKTWAGHYELLHYLMESRSDDGVVGQPITGSSGMIGVLAGSITAEELHSAILAGIRLESESPQPKKVPTNPYELLSFSSAKTKKPTESAVETLEPKPKGRYPKMGSGTEPTERLETISGVLRNYRVGKSKIYRLLKDECLTCWPNNKGVTRIDTNELPGYSIALKNTAERGLNFDHPTRSKSIR